MNGGTDTPKKSLAARTRLLRFAVAMLVVVIAAAVALWGDPEVCRQELVPESDKTVRLCGSPDVTDVPVAAVLAVVLMLLAPDLSEAGVAGVTLKRRVEEAKAEAATARADLASLRLTLTNNQVAAAGAVAIADGGADLLEKLHQYGLLKDSDGEAVPTTASTSGHAAGSILLVTTALNGMTSLLPDEWRNATVVGRMGDVTLVAGAPLEATVRSQVLARTGPLADAEAGRVAVTPGTASRPAVAAAPVVAGARHLGEVAVVLPKGTSLDEGAVVANLAPLQATFAALFAYVAEHGLS